MKRLLIGSLGLFLLLAVVVVVRTLMHQPPIFVSEDQVEIQLDETVLAERLSESIQFQTVSFQSSDLKDRTQFTGFIEWVKSSYPLLNERLELTMLNDSMLYRWVGSDTSLPPILVTGHYDVVPVIPGSEDLWQHPPFAGVIADGIIWGRGALDDKSGVLGILEAVTY
jgi:carboxypeptidase PM20D1